MIGVPTAKEQISVKEKCPFNHCDGSGLVYFTKDGLGYMDRCKCLELRERQRKIENLFQQAGIPKRFVGKGFENFEPRNSQLEWALHVAKRYAENFASNRAKEMNGLYLVGPTGTGKTHISYAIINYLIKNHQVSVLVETVPNLLELLRPKKRQDEAEERLELAKKVDVLLLDDLGAEKDTAWVTERLYLIINARSEQQLPTIITSNMLLTMLEVDEKGNKVLEWERITSRIREVCYQMVMDGDDYRKLDRP